jgi:hypothetical protein
MGQTWTARATAQDINAALRKAGIARTLDAKRVRAWVRDNVAAYDDDGYTAHLYDARTHAAVVTGIVARYTGKGRPAAASAGRTSSKVKPSKPAPATVAE